MTTKRAFLTAIVEAPFDDAPRLIFADWLEEQGDAERAEFIRVQCRLALPWSEDFGECWQCHCQRTGKQHTNGPCRCTSAWKELRQRERELRSYTFEHARAILPHTGSDWMPSEMLIDTPLLQNPCFLFRRGFIESITLSCAAFVTHATAIIEAVPMLQGVCLREIIQSLRSATAIGPRNRPAHRAYVWDVVWVDLAHRIIDAEGWAGSIDGVFRFTQYMRHATELTSFDSIKEAWQAISRGCLAYARHEDPKKHVPLRPTITR